jgi:hypothetical protein
VSVRRQWKRLRAYKVENCRAGVQASAHHLSHDAKEKGDGSGVQQDVGHALHFLTSARFYQTAAFVPARQARAQSRLSTALATARLVVVAPVGGPCCSFGRENSGAG